jgi:hypothetical protein
MPTAISKQINHPWSITIIYAEPNSKSSNLKTVGKNNGIINIKIIVAIEE